MAKALDGISIIEFSSNDRPSLQGRADASPRACRFNIGAAYAAMLLAEQGADVVRVESP